MGERFIEQLVEAEMDREEESEDDEDEPMEVEKERSFKEAIASLENIQAFLECQGYLYYSIGVGSIVDNMASLRSSELNQKTITDYFSNQ